MKEESSPLSGKTQTLESSTTKQESPCNDQLFTPSSRTSDTISVLKRGSSPNRQLTATSTERKRQRIAEPSIADSKVRVSPFSKPPKKHIVINLTSDDDEPAVNHEVKECPSKTPDYSSKHVHDPANPMAIKDEVRVPTSNIPDYISTQGLPGPIPTDPNLPRPQEPVGGPKSTTASEPIDIPNLPRLLSPDAHEHEQSPEIIPLFEFPSSLLSPTTYKPEQSPEIIPFSEVLSTIQVSPRFSLPNSTASVAEKTSPRSTDSLLPHDRQQSTPKLKSVSAEWRREFVKRQRTPPRRVARRKVLKAKKPLAHPKISGGRKFKSTYSDPQTSSSRSREESETWRTESSSGGGSKTRGL